MKKYKVVYTTGAFDPFHYGHLNILKKAIFGMILNIIGNYVLIPIYGIKGAAISTLFGHLAANLIYDIFDNRVRGQLKYKMRAFVPIYLLKRS